MSDLLETTSHYNERDPAPPPFFPVTCDNERSALAYLAGFLGSSARYEPLTRAELRDIASACEDLLKRTLAEHCAREVAYLIRKMEKEAQ